MNLVPESRDLVWTLPRLGEALSGRAADGG